MDYTILPSVNTALNAITIVLLLRGFHLIHHARDVARHKRCMLLASACSALFLTSYLIYHAKVGSVPYQGQGVLRPIYFSILISHIILAVLNVPLVVATLWHGFKDQRERHRFWARITLPVWLYVSLTGIVVYVMLYVMKPSGA